MADEHQPHARRRLVAERAGGCCEYCWSQEQYSPDSFSVEHVIPRSRGGTNDVSNLAFACQGCNNRKYTSNEGLDPVNGEPVPLFHPRQDHWGDHFSWSKDGALLVGMTPKGRATIEKLGLNRAGLVNLRLILSAVGKHPPEIDGA